MFKFLSKKLYKTFSKIKNYGRLTETHIKNILDEMYQNLLEADVALIVIQYFLKDIKKHIIGKKINNSFTPGQEFLKLVKERLTELLGSEQNNINFATKPPAIIMFTGLQGTGKTTSAIKLAYFLKKKYNKKVIVTSLDIYRPAALEQLKILAEKIKIDFYQIKQHTDIMQITRSVLQHAKIYLYDILIVDTAGRLHINNIMMEEIKNIYNILKPIENLFIVDSMLGQDAIISAKTFNNIIPITGIFLTKVDSDARGGAALSVKYIIKKPIKFIGNGEKINQIEIFNAETIARKILGMRKELLNIDEIQKKIDAIKKQNLIKNLNKKTTLSLHDFLIQLEQIKKFGSNNIMNIFHKLNINQQQYINNPIMNIIHVKQETIKNLKNIIHSMTKFEQNNIDILNFSRKKRISLGSGIALNKINMILKQYYQVKILTKKIKNNSKIKNMFNNMANFLNKKHKK
ncbi:signal recognition particle protein [Enterobacteriaceae endosymbiont of Macroplea mutica]|uniref:signal recognition particle protein n=1 Tax=Enterobacteriaceae endosymbiont of Macroplea mutica TaxID=2675791 RepID=UPI0014491AC6|nr:signal recognition particle receptor subunit alpha [Enterobacteriaceae endosymbiont of Macroplea mutica]QJC31405.1 signal recognition particle protein [Enterobacteriaceae endosymbiont of Macroplea mutica]